MPGKEEARAEAAAGNLTRQPMACLRQEARPTHQDSSLARLIGIQARQPNGLTIRTTVSLEGSLIPGASSHDHLPGIVLLKRAWLS
jgi:hypothetical protein